MRITGRSGGARAEGSHLPRELPSHIQRSPLRSFLEKERHRRRRVGRRHRCVRVSGYRKKKEESGRGRKRERARGRRFRRKHRQILLERALIESRVLRAKTRTKTDCARWWNQQRAIIIAIIITGRTHSKSESSRRARSLENHAGKDSLRVARSITVISSSIGGSGDPVLNVFYTPHVTIYDTRES